MWPMGDRVWFPKTLSAIPDPGKGRPNSFLPASEIDSLQIITLLPKNVSWIFSEKHLGEGLLMGIFQKVPEEEFPMPWISWKQ